VPGEIFFQKRVVCTKLDIYGFFLKISWRMLILS